MKIDQVNAANLPSLEGLRRALWPDSSIAELEAIMAAQPDYLVLTVEKQGITIGFAEISVRGDYVNGCETSPVAFLEGIYVDRAWRRSGVARALVDAAAERMAARDILEFASDALLDNTASHAFHKAAGFAETERVVYFRRLLGTRP